MLDSTSLFQCLLHLRGVISLLQESYSVSIRYRCYWRIMSLVSFVLYIELAALYYLGCLMCGIEPLVQIWRLICCLNSSSLWTFIPLSPQFAFNWVNLGMKLFVCGLCSLKIVHDIWKWEGRDDSHILVRCALERSLAVLLSLFRLSPDLSVRLEVFDQWWNIMQLFELATLLQAFSMAWV